MCVNLGWLIAAALFNRCYLPLRLPTLFFKLLLKQNNQTQSSTSKGSGKEREEWGQYLHYLYSQHNHNSTSERGDSKANRGSSKLPMSVSDDRSTTDASGLKADAGCLKLRGVHYEDRVWGRYRPSLADVLMLDNSLKQSVFQIINMKDSDFKVRTRI